MLRSFLSLVLGLSVSSAIFAQARPPIPSVVLDHMNDLDRRCVAAGGRAGEGRFVVAQDFTGDGRLDIDSVGLLVLTQDGRVARALIGEDSDIDKEYLVRVAYGDITTDVQAAFPREQLARLRHGLSLDGQPLRPAQVDWQNPEQLRFVLREGKKRQIRRMCEQVGLKVTGLKRIRIGRVLLGQLPQGQWRYLGEHERF